MTFFKKKVQNEHPTELQIRIDKLEHHGRYDSIDPHYSSPCYSGSDLKVYNSEVADAFEDRYVEKVKLIGRINNIPVDRSFKSKKDYDQFLECNSLYHNGYCMKVS